MRSTEPSYQDWLKQDLASLIETLELSDLQRHFLHSRWLGQVLWRQSKSEYARIWHYVLRLIAIIGGVLVPALVALSLSSGLGSVIIGWFTFVISIAVAISIAVEEFFHYGERWRHYRHTAELLKLEGWRFFQLSGPYREYPNHGEAYPVFANRVETVIRQDLEGYLAEGVPPRIEDKLETR